MSRSPELLGKSSDSLREAFGRSLISYAEEFSNVVVLDADIAGGTGAHHFKKAYPDRFFQCGIAEQNMISVSAGLAATGLIPVATTFCVFLLRAIEQVRLSIAYANMNVKIVGSHPGLDVGPDGGSAQCLEDIAAFRAIPNMTVLAPCDPLEVSQATRAMLEYEGPVFMRTGRSPIDSCLDSTYQFEFGKGKVVHDGHDITVIACGVTTGRAIRAAQYLSEKGISVRVVNLSTIKPIDKAIIIESAEKTGHIVTVEDHNVYGGLGSAVAEVLSQERPTPLTILGVHDTFGESGEPDELAEKYNISESAIQRTVLRVLNKESVFQ